MEQAYLELSNRYFSSKTILPIHNLHKYLEEIDKADSKIFEYKKGESIYHSEKPVTRIYEVLSGAVRISHFTESGEEVTSEILINGDIFGKLHTFSNNFSENAKALTNSTISVYDNEYFQKLKFTDPHIAAWFSDYIISRWIKLERRLLRINIYKTSDHVAFFYHVLNKQVTNSNGKEESLLKLISQKDMADMIGATRQTVATAIKELKHRGA